MYFIINKQSTCYDHKLHGIIQITLIILLIKGRSISSEDAGEWTNELLLLKLDSNSVEANWLNSRKLRFLEVPILCVCCGMDKRQSFPIGGW